MDGVVTKTAVVHSAAWKRMFDEFLLKRWREYGEPFTEFDHARDYLTYVDGRPRYQGVATFLKSRGVDLPFGAATDAPGADTVCGLGNRKNQLFNTIVEHDGVALYDTTVALICALHAQRVRVGLATSSRNAGVILGKTGTAALFETVVDGLVSERLGLRGKPEPDIFATASRNLGVANDRAIVIEDAVTGVQAGVRGGFALVVGLAREHNAAELLEQGADIVVPDLAATSLPHLSALVAAKRARLKPGVCTP